MVQCLQQKQTKTTYQQNSAFFLAPLLFRQHSRRQTPRLLQCILGNQDGGS
uniref:Uncharacterized protein n=1 Tax=Anguilla anguilla TaxID=7936 RepID=A0A0E9RAM5_ANGAN